MIPAFSHKEYLTISDCFGLILNNLPDNPKKMECQEGSSFLNIVRERMFFSQEVLK